MKLIIITFLLPLICVAALPEGDDFLGSRSCRFEGAFYDFDLSKTALARAPKWNPADSEFPPLSPKRAQAVAFAQVRSLLPEQYQQMHVYMVALEALCGSDWIYLVSFDYDRPGCSTGPPRRFSVPVYLNCSTITPQIRKVKQ